MNGDNSNQGQNENQDQIKEFLHDQMKDQLNANDQVMNELNDQTNDEPSQGQITVDPSDHSSPVPRKNPFSSPIKMFIGATTTLLFLIAISLFAFKSPDLFKADITEVDDSAPASAEIIYIPSHTGGPGEEGNLLVKARDNIGPFDSITFSLTYSPVDALIFDQNPIVFDSDTLFQSADFQMAAEAEPGKLVVTIILDAPVTVAGVVPATYATHETLFKLAVQIDPDAVVGQTIQLGGADLALLNETTTLTTAGSLTAGTIQVQGQSDLQVLSAEAIDSTHVAVHFSDYLSNNGAAANYFGGVLGAATAVESGNVYGYDQKTVVITTAAQTIGQRYILTVDDAGTVQGNVQGGVDSNYQYTVFYGYGDSTSALSDFGMVSATSSDYYQATIVFTDDITPSSVATSDFVLQNITTGVPAMTISSVSVSGNQLTITTADALLKRNTYLLRAVSSDAVLRQSDSASLGIDRVAFSGSDNGPVLVSGVVTRSTSIPYTYSATLTFNEDIHQAGGLFIGHLYDETGDTLNTSINAASGYNPVISGNTITLTNDVFNDPDKNFTFSVSDTSNIANSLNVPVDEANKTISFWGYDHDDPTSEIGGMVSNNRNTLRVIGDSLDFTTVSLSELSLFHYEDENTKVNYVINSINIIDGDLILALAANLQPNIDYILRIDDGAPPVPATVAVAEFSLEQDLSLVSAEAIGSTQVRVTFSENIDSNSVDNTNFSVSGMATLPAGFEVEGDFQHVRFTTTLPLTSGSVYQVTADDIHAYSGGDFIGKNVVAFGGYGTVAAESDVVLSSVTVLSGTTIRLEFSGPIDDSTFTPVNARIVSISGGSETNLTIADVSRVNATTFDLTTSKQTARTNYFISFNGVTDADSLLIGNDTILNFMGFDVPEPVVTTILPSTITNDDDYTITLTGQNLDIVEMVRIADEEVTITSQQATSLSVSVPAGLAQGSYDVVLIDQEGEMKTFENSLLVTASVQPMQIISAESVSIPYNVPNDGETSATLWVLVEDSQGLGNISSVIVDLSQINGSGSQEMKKDSGSQPQNRQWYTYPVTVPATVATRAEPYLLPVEVRKGSEAATGTVSLMVTKDIYQSVAPVVDQIYISPISVSPDGETPVKISAQVSDVDGADTITSVIADLGTLGVGFVSLSAMNVVEGASELTTRFYQSEEFIVSDTVATGTYQINITALDNTGESASQTISLVVSTDLTGPSIEDAYLVPRKSVPNDGKTPISLHASISDPDTLADITSVTADFESLGLPPAELIKGSNVSDDAKTGWYSVEGLIIPKTTPIGIHQLEITATDKAGGVANVIVQIDVTHKDTLGDPPRIIEDRAYTTPRVGVNDGRTLMTLYAFVRDDDDDIESVVVNLGPIGQVGAETFEDLDDSESSSKKDSENSSDGGVCPTGSDVLVCMNASIKEGDAGQWFILPDVSVSRSTAASSEPYLIEVIATDAGGKTVRGKIPVYINDGEALTNDKYPPEMVGSVATSLTTVEILFNEEISSSSVSSDGREFTITDQGDTSKKLDIIGATMNAAGNVVTLSTENQTKNKAYVVSATNDIRDAVGVPLVAGARNRSFFKGFQKKGLIPIVEYITATDVDVVEIEFRNSLKPSTLGRDNVEIFESDSGKPLDVTDVHFSDSTKVLQIKTDQQKGSQRYRVQINDVASYDGKESPLGLTTTFKGYNVRTAQHQAAANLADLDGNGKVDFADFTIFSSVYGTSYINDGDGEGEEDFPGEPIPPNPDSLVPHTSTPAGGEILEEETSSD